MDTAALLKCTREGRAYEELAVAACKNDEIDCMAQAISMAVQRGGSDSAFAHVLFYGCQAAVIHNSVTVLRYLLDRGARIQDMTICCDHTTSVPILEILLAHGWDINTRKMTGASPYDGATQPLLWHVITDPRMVAWCFKHGASVIPKGQSSLKDGTTITDAEDISTYENNVLSCPPILEEVAVIGDIELFKLLRDRGAPLGWRPLHRVVRSAALWSPYHHVPENLEKGQVLQGGSHFARQMTMIRFLIDEVGIDINAADQPKGKRLLNQFGTPLCYVASTVVPELDMTKITRFLLDRGAETGSALDMAMDYDNDQVIEVIRERQERQRQRNERGCIVQ